MNHQTARSELPPHLREQLDAFRKRLFAQESLLAAATTAAGLATSALAVFALDRLWETPGPVRLALLAGGLGAAGWAAARWVKLWVLHPRDDRQLSVLVQRHHRKLGDTLLSAIELAEGRIRDDAISPELRTAAITTIASQAAQCDFTRAVRWRAAMRLSAACGGAALLLGAIGWYSSPALKTTLARWLNPFSGESRHTFTRFLPAPPEKVVPRGEAFTVECAIDPASEWKPGRIDYRIGAMLPGSVPAANPSIIKLDGQYDPAEMRLTAGDGEQTVAIRPELRPSLLELNARVALPDYLKRPVSTEKCGGSLTLLEGSTVGFSGTASRPLKTLGADLDGKPLPVAPDGPSFRIPDQAARDNAKLRLTWADTLGLAATAPHEVSLKLKPDLPPEVRCPALASTTGMLADETLRIAVQADDDFGLRGVVAHCRHADSKTPSKIIGDQTFPVAEGAADKERMEGEFSFSPRLLGIPESSWVEFQAGASDYCPGHAEARSAVHRILVLSRAEHAKIIQDQMQALGDKLENLANREEQAKSENEDIAKLPDDKLKGDEAAQKLADQAKTEKANAEAARQLADQIKETAKEALRNKDIPKDAIEQMAAMAAAMEAVAGRNMPKAAESLENAQGKPEAGERQKEIGEATREQQKAIDEMRKAAAKLDKAQKQIDADSFINRLRHAAELQLAQVEDAKRLAPQITGLDPAAMAGPQKQKFALLNAAQKKLADAAALINADLAATYERTHQPPYQAVLADMEKEKLPAKNQSLIDNTNANRLFTLVGEGPALAALYNHWADMLQKEKKKGGGGGGGGQSDGKIPPELLMELLQMIQNEQGVRSETRSAHEMARQRQEAADAQPADAAEAARQAAEAAAQADARKVGARQIELREELAGLLNKYNPPPSDDPNDALDDALADAVPGFGDYSGKGSENKLPPDLVDLMGQTGKAMGDAASLLGQGETSSPAIAAETEALELLALLFEKSAEKSPSQATSMMQQMKESMMAGGKPGGQPGKKPGGKPGSQPGQGSTGSGSVASGSHGAHSGDAENRDNEKATGKIPGHIPPEYRESIESYHTRLDKLTASKPAGGQKP